MIKRLIILRCHAVMFCYECGKFGDVEIEEKSEDSAL